jgi:hypothetical protein
MCVVMDVTVKVPTQYEHCDRLECDAVWSVYQRTHCYIPEECILD